MKLTATTGYLVLLLSASAAVAAPITTKSGVLPTPAEGQGQVVFFRPGSMMGAALGCTVHEGEPQIARLGSGKYYVVSAAPGVHTFRPGAKPRTS